MGLVRQRVNAQGPVRKGKDIRTIASQLSQRALLTGKVDLNNVRFSRKVLR